MIRNYTSNLIKIAFLISLVVFVGVLVVRGEVIGSTFANHSGSGGLQLTIDSYSVYNDQFQPELSWELKDLVPGVDKFFNFNDIKPGDTGFNNISIHVAENPAYVCLDFSNLVDEENGVNEPESLVDEEDGGELSAAIEFFAWRDDGDNVFEVGERTLFGDTPQSAVVALNDTTYPLADATTDEVFEEDETYYVGIEWCAGNLSVDLNTAELSCDAETMGNEYQISIMRFTRNAPRIPIDNNAIAFQTKAGMPEPSQIFEIRLSGHFHSGLNRHSARQKKPNGYQNAREHGSSLS